MRNRNPFFNTKRVCHTTGGVLCAKNGILPSFSISNTFLSFPTGLRNVNSSTQTKFPQHFLSYRKTCMNIILNVCFNAYLPGQSRVIKPPYCSQYHRGLGTAGYFTYNILCCIRAKMYTIAQVSIQQ